MTIGTKRTLLLCELVFHITATAQELINKGVLLISSEDFELFQAVYNLASDYLDEYGDKPGDYVSHLKAYASGNLMLRFSSLAEYPGRIWWDIEQSDFVTETELYNEYLENRRDGLSFEEYILGCRTEENGTLVLAKKGGVIL